MTTPAWKEVLPTPPPGAQLQEAWMTTFDQPGSGLLVEHFLPSLLGLTHSLSQELQERTLFFGELGTTLESLHGRLTVISSPPREEREPSQYPWLWRYVGHFMVGAASCTSAGFLKRTATSIPDARPRRPRRAGWVVIRATPVPKKRVSRGRRELRFA